MDVKKELIFSADGSSTLFLPELNEHYHSKHGAIQEAMHVFIKNGLHQLNDKSELNILEIGFGTGLNCLLTTLNKGINQKISYYGIEEFPLEETILKDINYIEKLNLADNLFWEIHNSSWDKLIELKSDFYLNKIKANFCKIDFEANFFDLIYFDAFGPRVHPEAWTPEMFAKMFTTLKKNGVLVTYCAKGQVKRDLKAVGFKLETLPGPPGKREMVRVTK